MLVKILIGATVVVVVVVLVVVVVVVVVVVAVVVVVVMAAVVVVVVEVVVVTVLDEKLGNVGLRRKNRCGTLTVLGVVTGVDLDLDWKNFLLMRFTPLKKVLLSIVSLRSFGLIVVVVVVEIVVVVEVVGVVCGVKGVVEEPRLCCCCLRCFSRCLLLALSSRFANVTAAAEVRFSSGRGVAAAEEAEDEPPPLLSTASLARFPSEASWTKSNS